MKGKHMMPDGSMMDNSAMMMKPAVKKAVKKTTKATKKAVKEKKSY